jgi:hypothetical protein
LRTERGHLGNVERILGPDKPLDEFDLAAAQDYARQRLKEKHGRRVKRPILPYTARKELKSFRQAWTWCQARSLVAVGPTWELSHVAFHRGQEPERFRTMAEIQAIVDHGGLTARQVKML